MDTKTLKTLGIDLKELEEKIVEQAVQALLNETGFDEDGELTGIYETRFSKAIQAQVMKAVDAKIEQIAAELIVPRVGELIEKCDMTLRNRFGEPKTPEPTTFREYIAARAEEYMSEDVNCHGKSKREDDSYGWKRSGPRVLVLMRNYIQSTLEAHAKNAVSDINAVVAAAMTKASAEAIAKVRDGVKVSIAVKP